MSRRLPAVLLCLSFLLPACSRVTPVAPSATPEDQVAPVDLSILRGLENSLRAPTSAAEDPERRRLVVVPAGSVDALAAAIEQVGVGGFVLLRSGLHHESAMVEVNKPVVILGEPGTVLESSIPTWPAASPTIQAALWIHGAPGAAVRGVEMRPAGGIGGAAILVEDSPGVAIFQNNLHDYQYSVLVQNGDRARIWSNRISATTAWQTDPSVPEAHGIVIVNGANTVIALNQVSNALFGIWACDRAGLVVSNRISASFVGLILCKVPAGGFTLPSGVLAGAASSATGWLAQGNETFGNFTTGLLVIDGANGNRVASNNSHDNGGHAVELTGDTFRFGFLTPASFNNVFVAGAFPGIDVKDCGNGNRIFGGTLVDNALEPCD